MRKLFIIASAALMLNGCKPEEKEKPDGTFTITITPKGWGTTQTIPGVTNVVWRSKNGTWEYRTVNSNAMEGYYQQ